MNFKKSQPIRIVIADDHPIFRDGLRRLLEAEEAFFLRCRLGLL